MKDIDFLRDWGFFGHEIKDNASGIRGVWNADFFNKPASI